MSDTNDRSEGLPIDPRVIAAMRQRWAFRVQHRLVRDADGLVYILPANIPVDLSDREKRTLLRKRDKQGFRRYSVDEKFLFGP